MLSNCHSIWISRFKVQTNFAHNNQEPKNLRAMSDNHGRLPDGFSQAQNTRPRGFMQNPLSQITEHVFLAGVTGVTRPDLLRSAQITHVLNVAGGECSHLTYDLGPDPASFGEKSALDGSEADLTASMIVKSVSLRDSEEQSLLPYLDDLVDFVSAAVTSGGKVVVHCMAGVSRSASVVIAYLIRDHGMSLKEAHDHVIARRDVIRPNPGFWIALIEYELNIRGDNSVEILNYAAGSVPSLENYRKEMHVRLRLGWMDHLFYNFGVQVLMLIVQMLSSLWIFSDYSR